MAVANPSTGISIVYDISDPDGRVFAVRPTLNEARQAATDCPGATIRPRRTAPPAIAHTA